MSLRLIVSCKYGFRGCCDLGRVVVDFDLCLRIGVGWVVDDVILGESTLWASGWYLSIWFWVCISVCFDDGFVVVQWLFRFWI